VAYLLAAILGVVLAIALGGYFMILIVVFGVGVLLALSGATYDYGKRHHICK
jgi:threonine/homoserine/homoserine lactone efflux protein